VIVVAPLVISAAILKRLASKVFWNQWNTGSSVASDLRRLVSAVRGALAISEEFG
jgi:hypothetical protein